MIWTLINGPAMMIMTTKQRSKTMSAFGNDEKDEVYYTIKNFLEEGHKISELMDILRYAFEAYEFEKENENG